VTDRYSTLRLGLVGAWCPSLGGDSALLVRERVGRGHHLTGSGTSFGALPGGTALRLTGVASAAATSTTAQRTLNGSVTGSLAMWMYKATAGAIVAGGFTGDSGSGNRFSILWNSDGTVYASFENGGLNFSYTANNVAGWSHIAVTFDGSIASAGARATIFINGTARSSSSTGGNVTALSSSLGTFALGRDDSSRTSTGAIDDARVYSRVLTPAEIRLLASQRGIGLSPTRHRRARLAAAATTMWLNVGGTWKATTPKINVAGTWKTATPKIKVAGVWQG
jgi:hypothetical protein